MVVETNGRAMVRHQPTDLIDSFKMLDVYAGGISEEAPRVESIATISAGFRSKGDGNRPGNPQRSKDGTIYLHDATGRAAGLKRALDQTGGKRLTIAFPFDDPAKFIHARFMRYSASALEAFGDDTHLMVMGANGYRRVEAGTQDYRDHLATCKVSVSVYFCLSEWTKDGPEIVFPDGVGAYYRLRFTSRHSLRSIISGLKSVGQFSQGRIAGVPFELAIDYREVAGPDGKKRTIPVWTINMKPAAGFRLSSGNFSGLMTLALEQGAALMLPAPTPPTLDSALQEPADDDLDESIVDGVVVQPSDRDIDLMQRGGRCNTTHYRNFWHTVVKGSRLANDIDRAEFFRTYTNGATGSLIEFLDGATDKEAARMIERVDDLLRREQSERSESPAPKPSTEPTGKRSYRDLFPDDEDTSDPQEPAFDRDRLERHYAMLASYMARIKHKESARVNSRKASDFNDADLAGSVKLLRKWCPELTDDDLDGVANNDESDTDVWLDDPTGATDSVPAAFR